jgi:hypothetical protein
MKHRSVGVGVIAISMLLFGCPPKAEQKATPVGCQKVGDSCEFSPGKLGTCVARDDCHDANCFVCQSQH